MDMKEKLQELAEAARKRIEEADSYFKEYEGCCSGRPSESRTAGK